MHSLYGIRGDVLHWIKDFLSNRRQRVIVNGKPSGWCSVKSGIPQGSVLGPVLFVIYINDLPEVVHSMVQMFADDTKVFRRMEKGSDSRDLQKDLNNMQKWSSDWQLKFNASKCKVMHLGGKNSKHIYVMNDGVNNVPLSETMIEKDLGVKVDNKLTFSDHIQEAANRANGILAIIRRSYTYLDEDVVRRLYTSLARPLLEYGNVVWSPLYRKDAESIERIQRRATKLVHGFDAIPYEQRMRHLKIPSMYYRRARGDMIEVFKYLHGIYKTGSPLIRDSNTRTRGHSLKLRKRYSRLDLRHNFFGFRVVDLWNDLPESVVAAESVNCFKSRLDAYWSSITYILEPVTVATIHHI
ncbi:MAG: hypothetical protein FE834_05320 [Gammaproteobacteria bacterium]|nr:hypothetical protein [Gammaproteobacteria bacterium]